MTRLQVVVVVSALSLFFVMYFGCDTKPKTQLAIEKNRALSGQSADVNVLLKEAKASLTAQQAANILALEKQLEAITNDSTKATLLEQLSGSWYQLKHPELAGYFAEQIADIRSSEEAWSIAGTTYTLCVQRVRAEKIRDFCTERAIKAFENASSLNTENLAHKINLALVHTENPPQDNPMKGVLMLVDLNKQYPENVSILTSLGRLAIKTGQYERAITRLEQVLTLAPDNVDAFCLLAQAYEGLGNAAKVAEFSAKCTRG